jgi:hypothetical protein
MSYNGMMGHLVVIDSSAESVFVSSITLPEKTYWIGARKFSSVYSWDTGPEKGVELSYTNWGQNQPSGVSSDPCLAMNSTGSWQDASCQLSFLYIIEYERMRRESFQFV